MCLGEFGVVVTAHRGEAAVEFDDGSVRTVSAAVLVADGIDLGPGDRVMVSMGMALRRVDQLEHRVPT